MTIPDHLNRFPTSAAIRSLSERLSIPVALHSQDWEYEVADPNRFDEFLNLYESGSLDEDERFVLMMTLLQSLEESDDSVFPTRWADLTRILDRDICIHIHTVWYWSDLDNHIQENQFRLTCYVRDVLRRHETKFLSTPG